MLQAVSAQRKNPRWNGVSGQDGTVVLRNATLFDGEGFVGAVDVVFSKGVVGSVSKAGVVGWGKDVEVVDLGGKIVTPGLVDLHSHHLVQAW